MSQAIYRLLLRLYPLDLRLRWGQDMADTFALQLEDARKEGGWTAVSQVWFYALAEIFQVALPLQATSAALLIPTVSLLSSGLLLFGLTWALENSLALHSLYRQIVKLGA